MKIPLLGLALLSVAPAPRSQDAAPLRFATFNIRYGTADDGADSWPQRRDRVVTVIRELAPHVLGVQEALAFQVEHLRRELPGMGFVGQGREGGERGEYSGVFWDRERLALVDHGDFWLSETPGVVASVGWDAALPRMVTWAVFAERATGARFRVWNTHFDHRGRTARTESGRLLGRLVRASPLPDVVLGDLNSGEDSEALAALREAGLRDTWRELHPDAAEAGTFTGFRGHADGAKIDYVLADAGFTTVEAAIVRRRVDDRDPSDHWPVTAELRLAASGVAAEALFDGTLDGWTKRGGRAEYHAEGETIVGTTRVGPNTFLCTDRTVADFELRYEFRADPGVNSGVQVRSAARPGVFGGAVHGYQVEIDTSDRAWTAGLYDEMRRGWLDDLADAPEARAAFRQGEWNAVRVLCDGPRIATWLNGVPAADHLDVFDLAGFVALQVHGVGPGAPERTIRWRGLELRPLGLHAWRNLFDGESLAGWNPKGGGEWRLDGGVLTGTHTADDPRQGVLLGERDFDDFAVRVVWRATAGNSGFYFRSEPVDAAVIVHGFQAEIDPKRDSGMLYETGGRGRVVVPEPELVRQAIKDGDWNETVVIARHRRIAVELNGTRMSELRDDPGRLHGRFGLQLHGGQDVHLEVRAIDVLERVPGVAGACVVEADSPAIGAEEALVEDVALATVEGAAFATLRAGTPLPCQAAGLGRDVVLIARAPGAAESRRLGCYRVAGADDAELRLIALDGDLLLAARDPFTGEPCTVVPVE